MSLTVLGYFLPILVRIILLGGISDDPKRTVLRSLRDESSRILVHLNLLDSQFGRARNSREKGNEDYQADEKAGDLYTVGTLDDVDHGRIGEDQRNQGKSRGPN